MEALITLSSPQRFTAWDAKTWYIRSDLGDQETPVQDLLSDFDLYSNKYYVKKTWVCSQQKFQLLPITSSFPRDVRGPAYCWCDKELLTIQESCSTCEQALHHLVSYRTALQLFNQSFEVKSVIVGKGFQTSTQTITGYDATSFCFSKHGLQVSLDKLLEFENRYSETMFVKYERVFQEPNHLAYDQVQFPRACSGRRPDDGSHLAKPMPHCWCDTPLPTFQNICVKCYDVTKRLLPSFASELQNFHRQMQLKKVVVKKQQFCDNRF